MKHIISFNELKKSTLRKTANELELLHKKRSDVLLKWAHLNGENEQVDRIWPERFHMDNDSRYIDEYYSIIDCDTLIFKEGNYSIIRYIELKMISNWGREGYIELSFHQRDTETSPKIIFRKMTWREYDYKFRTRKEALGMYRFIKDYFENQEEYLIKCKLDNYKLDANWDMVKGFTVNKLWESN